MCGLFEKEMLLGKYQILVDQDESANSLNTADVMGLLND